jgi:hypothetical protein
MKLSLLVAFLLGAAAPVPEIRYFQFERAIDRPQTSQDQVCFVLDTGTFAHAAPELADLRLYRGSDETPYVIHFARPSQAPPATIAPMNQGVRGGKTVFDATMPEGEYSDLRLNLTGQNFLATVQVTGSQAVAGPATRIGTYTIFDFSNQRLGRSTVLHLPRSNFRYLHFEISGPIAPDRILGVAATSAPPSEPRYVTILNAGQFVRKGKASTAVFSLPANVPVERIAFAPGAQPVNFSREVEVQAAEIAGPESDSASPREPSTVASGDLLRIHYAREGHRIDEEHLALETPGAAFPAPTRWTITVQNGDDSPIPFSGVQVQMIERNVCFESAAGAPYALYYGDKALSTPRYDYAAWFAFQPTAVAATLGPEKINAAFEKRPDQRPFTERHPVLLWVALGIVVVLLGAIALRTARRIDPHDPPTP